MYYQSGTVIDKKYALLHLLGAGGAASVWEAEHLIVGKHVAVKLLHPELAEDQSLRTRFVDEARAAAQIAHANVVDIYDLGITAEGVSYMVMERLRGETLDQVLKARGSLGPAYACELMLQVLAGLNAAHCRGIIHRDLKPANVIVTHPIPDRPHVKVLDFGIAKILGQSQAPASEVVVGTPLYMSAEQASGRGIDERSDIYSAAAMLYEMLTGVPPIPGDDLESLLSELCAGRFRPIREADPEVPDELARIVEGALCNDPESRPRSALRFAQLLKPFVCQGFEVSLPPSEQTHSAPIPLFNMPARRAQPPAPVVLNEPTPTALSRDFPPLQLPRVAPPAGPGGEATDSLLCSPRIPKAPTTPDIDPRDPCTASAGELKTPWAPADDLGLAEARGARRQGRMAADVRSAALATLTGFGIGMAIAWLSGAI